MATLVIRNPDGTEQEQEVAEQLTVGRAEGNDLILSEGGVSRKHARFFVDGDAVLVEDVGSANGTWVDGARIENAFKLGPKNQVVIGEYEIAVKLGQKPRPSASSRPGKPSAAPTRPSQKAAGGNGAEGVPRSTRVMPSVKPSGGAGALAKRAKPSGAAAGPTLRGLTGAITGQNFPLSGTMTVGRVQGNDVRIDDDSVSRRHAELSISGREVVLRDLGSANGTTVNGAPISEDTPLSNGDIIQFGVVEVMYEGGPASGGRAAAQRPSRG
ncbi:MAG: FHA domain-containing protein, partial [Deltaproteobacteria bacterium]|nr:FHA domain-containing protein [Deltaproteobacteria bacterium]